MDLANMREQGRHPTRTRPCVLAEGFEDGRGAYLTNQVFESVWLSERYQWAVGRTEDAVVQRTKCSKRADARPNSRKSRRPVGWRRQRTSHSVPQSVSVGVRRRKLLSSICLTRKSATSAREMNPEVQSRGSTRTR